MTWNTNPLIAAALLFPTWAYLHGVMALWGRGGVGRGVSRRQVALYLGGMAALFLALMSPIDGLGEELLSAHMIQHLLLIVVAPPLLVVGTPPTIFLWVLPMTTRRRVGRWWGRSSLLAPVWRWLSGALPAWLIHAAAVWLWHIPVVYEAAVVDPFVHLLEHASFLLTALLFWHVVLPRDRSRYLLGALLIFTTALHSSILGALMTFSSRVWYPIYVERAPVWGLTALEDQQLAGLLMWIPAGVVYLIAALALIGSWLNAADRAEQVYQHATRDLR